MKNLLLTVLVVALCNQLSAQGGFLDVSFDTDGKVKTPIVGLSTDEVNALAIQPDGKIIAAGSTLLNGNSQFALVRYMEDGTLDNTFSSDGKLTVDFSPKEDIATAIAIQSDGKIVVAGRSRNISYFDFALLRFLPDGRPDTSFNGTGKVTTNFNSNNDEANAVLILPDGKILAAGGVQQGDYYDFALTRYLANGAPDSSFGVNSQVILDFYGNTDKAFSLGLQPDGKIVAAGYAINGTYADFALARFFPDGTPDSTFHFDGKQTVDISTFDDFGQAMALQPDGKIVVAGYAKLGSTQTKNVLARFNQDGELDNTFGSDGKLITFVYNTFDVARAVALQSNGNIVIAGNSYSPVYENDFSLSCFTPDGDFDTAFHSSGKVTTDFNITIDKANAVAVQADGKIVAAGISGSNVGGDFALARYLPGVTSTNQVVSEQIALHFFPNPLAQQTGTLEYELPEATKISLYLVDAQGRIVRSFQESLRQETGKHTLEIRLPDELANGTYLLVLALEGRLVGVKNISYSQDH